MGILISSSYSLPFRLTHLTPTPLPDPRPWRAASWSLKHSHPSLAVTLTPPLRPELTWSQEGQGQGCRGEPCPKLQPDQGVRRGCLPFLDLLAKWPNTCKGTHPTICPREELLDPPCARVCVCGGAAADLFTSSPIPLHSPQPAGGLRMLQEPAAGCPH